MYELKTKINDADVSAYLDAVESEQQRNDSFALIELLSELTGHQPKMWGTSIVGFGSHHYVYASGREGDWPLIGFSPRKQNISIYIMAGFSEYESLMKKLGKHKTGKSCLYIKKLADIDVKVLRDLSEASIAWMRKTYESN